jgi:hypothetical protein
MVFAQVVEPLASKLKTLSSISTTAREKNPKNLKSRCYMQKKLKTFHKTPLEFSYQTQQSCRIQNQLHFIL